MKEYQNWKNSRASEMADLTLARPTDIFIYIRFTEKVDEKIESREVLYADDMVEVTQYIRNIFLYDILNDAIDDMEYDFKEGLDEKQFDIIFIMSYWFKLGKALKCNKNDIFFRFIAEFNARFNNRENNEYEICILNGADELRKFLSKKYEQDERFDQNKLNNICNNEFFVGRLLKDFVANLFNS